MGQLLLKRLGVRPPCAPPMRGSHAAGWHHLELIVECLESLRVPCMSRDRERYDTVEISVLQPCPPNTPVERTGGCVRGPKKMTGSANDWKHMTCT